MSTVSSLPYVSWMVDEAAGHLRDGVEGHRRRPDVLGDGPGFAGGDSRSADAVQQARLAVVDVAQDGDDWRSEGFGVGLWCGVRVRHRWLQKLS